MLKKTILSALAGTALLASNVAFADRDHHRHKHYKVKHHYVQHRPVVHHYHHRPAVVHREVVVHRPAPVYYRPAPVYYQPAPVYYEPVNPNAGLVIAGALIGGAVAWHIVNGH